MDQVLSSSRNEEVNRNWAKTLKFSKEKIFVAASLIFAFFIRFLYIPQNTVINGDGIYYATLGKKLISGDFYGGISAYWSPLYSLFVGISSLFFSDPEYAGRFVSVIAGALLIVPAYILIGNLYGRLCACFGVVLLTVHPLLIKSSGWIMTESLYTLIFTTGILSTWYALRDGKAKYFLMTGLLFGLGYLTKPEALGFIGLLLVLSVGAKFFRQNISFRTYLTGFLFILLGFTIFFLPYVIFLHQKTGQWTISQKIMINFPAADYDGELMKLINGQITMQDRIWGDNYETDISRKVAPPPVKQLPTAPPPGIWSSAATTVTILGSKAFILLKKQFRDYIPELIPYFFILIAIVGFFYKPWTRSRTAREVFLFLFFISTLIGYALSAVELRYLFPVIPILICWTAHGIVGVSEWTSKSLLNLSGARLKITPLSLQIVTLIVMVVMLFSLFAVQLKPDELQNVPFEEKQAGLWIKNNSESAPLVVMSSHGTAAFYAGAKHLFVPDEDFSTVLEYAKRQKVNYLVFSQRRLKNTPNAFPADEDNLPEELRIVYKDEQNPDYKIIVYRLSS
jgi:4-amino-4-deoxy-L-arabinose transferase-like glycosyltransferase